jgi:hypothetical protein
MAPHKFKSTTSKTMNNHKATPEQWKKVEESAAPSAVVTGGSTDSCILELRARVEALEAQANHSPGATKMVPPPVATDKELSEAWYKAPEERMKRFRAIYNLGVTHGQAGSRNMLEQEAGR